MLYLLLQVFTYGFFVWFLWIAISFCVAFYGGKIGVLFGHVVIGVFIVSCDLYWIQESMIKPDWNGVPDMDIIFCIGVVIRVIIVNSLLLGVSVLGLHFREK
ncbi:hypothetical protein [Candidatus Uabimicrobium sp. HlEnr_7]|uniref:hypothetical protein n=1 Tax=Candidatus Uabimicrobium helgolandensis TaxID=3095367 RepID=UPI003555F8E2